MKSKRKSILVRMLRPVSVAFGVWLVTSLRAEKVGAGLCCSLTSRVLHPEMEFDLDKALEEVPIHLEDLPHASSPAAASQLDGPWPTASNLPAPPTPNELPPPLEHHTKSRPKPRKRTRPSRPAVGGL